MRRWQLGVIVLAFALGALLGCMSPAQESIATSNKAVSVALLFEVDGCRVYRFGDGGYSRYFANCGGGTTTTMWTERHSKTDTPQSLVAAQ